MEIYIDYRTAKDKISLAQAIRVIAMTYRDDVFNILVDDETGTLIETDNIHFIKDLDDKNIPNLYTTDTKYVNEDMIKIAYLKTPDKKNFQRVLFGDLANNNLSIFEKYEILDHYHLIDDKRHFAIMNSSLELPAEYNDFIEKYKYNQNIEGILKPEEIVDKDIANILTTYEVSNVFIDSLYYTVSFLKLLYQDDSNKPGVLKQMFSFKKTQPYKCVVINALLEQFYVYLSKTKCIFVNLDDMNYNYYFSSLTLFIDIIRNK